MRELNLELTGYKSNDYIAVRIDGTPVKLKKNDAGNLTCNHKTENDQVKIEVFKLLNIGSFCWFITQLFFFLITLFGLFGTHYKEKCIVIDFEIDVALEEENSIILQLNDLPEGNKAIDITTDLVYDETSNLITIDTDAKKVIKALKITKFLLAIATIALILSLF